MNTRLFIMRFVWCVSLTLLSAANAEPVVSATLSTNVVHVGDRVSLTVTAEHDANQRIILENFERRPFITVWNFESNTKEAKDQRQVTTYKADLSSFVVGQHLVSTNQLIVLEADGSQRFIPLPELLLNVSSLLSNPPPALAEIHPALPLPSDRWIRIGLMVLALIVLGIVIALLIRRWLNRPEKPEAARAKPSHEIALNALDTLLKRGYIEDGNAEAFYVELSSIVRLYLEERFDLHAPEQTTEEFIRTSSNSNALSAEQRQVTQEFLEQSDLVKFARFTPGEQDMRQAWDAGAKLVRETIPAPAVKHGGAS